MWGVLDVSVWTNPCLSVPNIVLSRENPLAAGYSKADLPELQPLYCIIWKAVAGRVRCAERVEPNGHEWCMGCRKRHLEFTVNLLSCIQGKSAHCCGLFSKAVCELLWTTLLLRGPVYSGTVLLGNKVGWSAETQSDFIIFEKYIFHLTHSWPFKLIEIGFGNQNTHVYMYIPLYTNAHAHSFTKDRSTLSSCQWNTGRPQWKHRAKRSFFWVLRRPEKWKALSHCSSQRSNAIQSHNMAGGSPTSATACTLRVSNRKGPFSRTVAPCEPSTFVKGEGWSQKGGERKKLFLSLLHVAAVALHTEVC